MPVPVSVIIPLHNEARFLRAAVLSVLAENLGAEVLVVDDGSTDGGAETIRDLPVTVLHHPRRLGAAAARNRGIRAARGELIAFLDADDLLVAGGLRERLAWLRARPRELAIGGRLAGLIGPDGERLPHEARPQPPALSLAYFAGGGTLPAPMWLFLFRRELLAGVGEIDERLTVAHDRDYILRILLHHSLPLRDIPVALYRVGHASLSREAGGRVSRRATAEWLLVHHQYQLPVPGLSPC
jgi:glycosyltransferase involved in cell wall biosynthesis